MTTAFEAITTRQAWFASEVLTKYEAAMIGADGKYAKADGTGQFAGIVQYGAEAADRMVTVVKGTFPALAAVEITAGDKVTIDATNAGQFKVAAASDVVYGAALTDASAEGLFTLSMADVPAPKVV